MSDALALVLVILTILIGGLFVAAEFSLVSLRRPVVEERAAAGDRRARMVTKELSDLSFSLSSAQFGITATSLICGYLVERAVGNALIRPLLESIGLPDAVARPLSFVGSFLLPTIVQMVLAELFPKNLAIARPIAVALAVTPVTRGFGIAFGPLIRIFDRSARWVTRRVFRVEVIDELPGGRSLAELGRIIAASGEEGSLTQGQAALLQRAVLLGDRRVGEVMVPRPDVVWLRHDESLVAMREASRRTGHSRFPVIGEGEDDVVGTVHVKDLLGVPADGHASKSVGDIATPVITVPESADLRRLLTELRREHRTFAVVIDEYGGTAGIVTLEDVLEELVGDIEDEFDRAGQTARRIGVARHLVRGSLRLDEAVALLGVSLPEGEYETMAGFVLDRLGHIPERGEQVVHDGLVLTVSRLDGMRITELLVERAPEAPAPESEPERDR